MRIQDLPDGTRLRLKKDHVKCGLKSGDEVVLCKTKRAIVLLNGDGRSMARLDERDYFEWLEKVE